MSAAGITTLCTLVLCAVAETKDVRHEISIGSATVNIFDLGRWGQFRETIHHPATVYKADDIARAKENLKQHEWARKQLNAMEAALPKWWGTDAAFFEKMIPATTPGAEILTMCPHCEYSPTHGQYDWDPANPETLTCKGCGTVYPNEMYPEDLILEATATGLQRFTYYGGKSWNFYGHHVRSSWTGQIRARKVGYMAWQASRFATVYALTGNLEYARTARRVLLRFAEVYPSYLVKSGYGEYADLPPKLAAVSVNNLPADELTFPPNKPNRKLHPGYWMVGRAEDTGMEGAFLLNVTTAYDLTCEVTDENAKPLYSRPERERIERDLLLEATYLLMADDAFNNKSITNRRATALVGACVGDPMRVRFGLEAFEHMVNQWYLYDGIPGETPAYGHMTLSGILPMSEGLTGYSDPEGFAVEGRRIDRLDLYARPGYRAVFRALVDTILPDLCYPAWADSYPSMRLSADLAEVTAVRYPGDHMMAVLQATCGGNVDRKGNEFALFHRNPAFHATLRAFTLSSTHWPAWKIGYLRMGRNGTDGTAILSSSDWGNHHHHDALNLSLFWQDRECLTDFGYLWDSPYAGKTRRTLAHNLVLINGKDQEGPGRHGSLHLYDTGGPFQVAEMSSTAYPDASLYRRTVVTIPLGDKGYAAVDFFRVAGGQTHDLVYHGPNDSMTLRTATATCRDPLYDLTDVQAVTATTPWPISWKAGKEVALSTMNLPQTDEKSYVARGWGSRDRADTETKTTYVIRRRLPDAPTEVSCFTTVHVPQDSDLDPVAAERSTLNGSAIAIHLRSGEDHYWILSQIRPDPQKLATKAVNLETDGLLTILHLGRQDRSLYLLGGTFAHTDDGISIQQDASISAPITEVRREKDESSIVIRTDFARLDRLKNLTAMLTTDTFQTGFRILDASTDGPGKIRLITRRGEEGFEPIDATQATIHHRSMCQATTPAATGSAGGRTE